MVLDKSLILKGLAGVATLGGTIGSTIIFRKELGLVKDTNSPDGVDVDSSSHQDPQVDSLGIPTKCNSSNPNSPCELSQDELKKIKFDGLGEESEGEDVTVENFPSGNGQKITLKIEGDSSKKYIFNNNSSSAVTVKRGNGEDKKVTLSVGDTEFTVVNNKLKKVVAVQPRSPAQVDQTTDEYGIPTKCNSSNPCQLTIDELKNIKFKELDGDGDVTVEPSNPNPSITLSFVSSPSNKYTFNNTSTSAVTIKKGTQPSKTVTLDVGETEFTLESKKLKLYVDPKVESLNTKLTNLKFPEQCKFKNSEKTNTTKECEVTVAELKKVEFENRETNKELTITGPTAGNIKIEIKRLKKETDTGQYGSSFNEDDLRFIFKEFTGQITISNSSGNSSIIIPEGSNTVFQMNNESKLNKSHKNAVSFSEYGGLICTTNNRDCTPYGSSKATKILNQPSESFEELKGVEDSKNIFTVDENTANYNQGYKFTVKETISGASGSPSLTKDDTYEIKYVSDSWGLVKKT